MRKMKEKAGFSLLEVMIALLILMFGLVGIVGLQVAAIHHLGVARHKSIATQLAGDVLEYLKLIPVDTVTWNSATIFYDSNNQPFVDADGQALLYDVSVANGINTWHRLGFMSAEGDLITNPANWRPDHPYVVAYAVEWGGATGSQYVQSTAPQGFFTRWSPDADLVTSNLPAIVPDAHQIYIEVWIGWLERGDEDDPRLTGVIGKSQVSLVDVFNNMISSPPSEGALNLFTKRRVIVRTIRDLDME